MFLFASAGTIGAKQTVILSGKNSVLEVSGAGTNRAYSLSPVRFLCRGMFDMQTKAVCSQLGLQACDGDDKAYVYIILRSCYNNSHQASAMADSIKLIKI